MKKILVSACLYGETCRYDGKLCPCTEPLFLKWKEQGILVPVCPERDGGLSTPRNPCEIKNGKVITKDGKDFTAEYVMGAEKALESATQNDVLCCIMKSNSPSCGCGKVYDGSFTGTKTDGNGIASELLLMNGFKVFNESELEKVRELICNLQL